MKIKEIPPSDSSEEKIKIKNYLYQEKLLVIQAEQKEKINPTDLQEWIKQNHPWLEQKLLEQGAILFRNFQINSADDFEAVARCIDNDLKNDYLGTSPRNAKSKYVFSASELPSYYPIPQHCEMSFLDNPPRRLFFYCHIPPKKDGETPIVDFRKVYQQMDAKIREEFEQKGLTNIRNYNGPASKSGFDLWKLKRWDQMFLTEDKKIAEEICRKNRFNFEWLGNDKLRIINTHPAVKKHPQSSEMVWFNHSQVFHLAAAAIEYAKIARRQTTFRAWFFSKFTSLMTFFRTNLIKTENQALHCTFGDGSLIPASYIRHIQDIIWQNMIFFSWQKGDMIVIDNFSTSHGRMPYTGEREIMVSWTS